MNEKKNEKKIVPCEYIEDAMSAAEIALYAYITSDLSRKYNVNIYAFDDANFETVYYEHEIENTTIFYDGIDGLLSIEEDVTFEPLSLTDEDLSVKFKGNTCIILCPVLESMRKGDAPEEVYWGIVLTPIE